MKTDGCFVAVFQVTSAGSQKCKAGKKPDKVTDFDIRLNSISIHNKLPHCVERPPLEMPPVEAQVENGAFIA